MARRVLLVDDSEITLKVIAHTLTAAGYDVQTSTTVTNLASAFGAWSPDIILADVNMPELSGVELCRRLKSSYETAHVPVVLYSSLSDAELEVLARECEADAYLSKQSGPEALPAELARLIAYLG
jgi:two-component system cell cycle response regulator